MIKKAVILCGGNGTRFLPITKSIPKEMLPLLDKPILQTIVENLSDSGITDILIVLNKTKDIIKTHFNKNEELELLLEKDNKFTLLKKLQYINKLANISYVYQPNQLGTGDALLYAKEFVKNDNFLLMYGDEVMLCNLDNMPFQLIKCFEKHNKNIIGVQTCDKKDVFKYGIIKPKPIDSTTYSVLDLVEKPTLENAPSNICFLGASVLTSEVLTQLENINLLLPPNSQLPLTDALLNIIKQNKVIAKLIDGTRIDVGNKLGFLKANIYAGLKDPEICNDLKTFLKSIL